MTTSRERDQTSEPKRSVAASFLAQVDVTDLLLERIKRNTAVLIAVGTVMISGQVSLGNMAAASLYGFAGGAVVSVLNLRMIEAIVLAVVRKEDVERSTAAWYGLKFIAKTALLFVACVVLIGFVKVNVLWFVTGLSAVFFGMFVEIGLHVIRAMTKRP